MVPIWSWLCHVPRLCHLTFLLFWCWVLQQCLGCRCAFPAGMPFSRTVGVLLSRFSGRVLAYPHLFLLLRYMFLVRTWKRLVAFFARWHCIFLPLHRSIGHVRTTWVHIVSMSWRLSWQCFCSILGWCHARGRRSYWVWERFFWIVRTASLCVLRSHHLVRICAQGIWIV